MTEEGKQYFQNIETHGMENGWVSPLTEEDKEFFATFAWCAGATTLSPPRPLRWSTILLPRSQRVSSTSSAPA